MASIALQETESEAAAGEVRVERGRMVLVLPLTDREREVLGLVAGGRTGGEIARHLVLSPETIKSHVQNAMAKLGAQTRAHAVAIALRTGQIDTTPLVEPPPSGALQ